MITIAIDGIVMVKQFPTFQDAIKHLDKMIRNLECSIILITNVQTGSSHSFRKGDFQ